MELANQIKKADAPRAPKYFKMSTESILTYKEEAEARERRISRKDLN